MNERFGKCCPGADTVWKYEQELNKKNSPDREFAFEERNDTIVGPYSPAYSIAYNVERNGGRKMRIPVNAVASFWYTTWVDAGQTALTRLSIKTFSQQDLKEFELLNQ